jgi:hypothetical protein
MYALLYIWLLIGHLLLICGAASTPVLILYRCVLVLLQINALYWLLFISVVFSTIFVRCLAFSYLAVLWCVSAYWWSYYAPSITVCTYSTEALLLGCDGVTFTYRGRETRTITRLLKNTNIRIAYKTMNTLQNHLRPKNNTTDIYNKSGIAIVANLNT